MRCPLVSPTPTHPTPKHPSLAQAQVNPEAEGDLGVPQIVQGYHTLYPLEDVTNDAASPALGVSTQASQQGVHIAGGAGRYASWVRLTGWLAG